MSKTKVRMRTTYSQPYIEWPGFDGTGYKVDYGKIWGLPVSFGVSGTSIKDYETSTVGELAKRFQKPVNVKRDVSTTIETQEGTFNLHGSGFIVTMLTTFMELRELTESASYCMWNYYDEDHVTDDVHRTFAFFITSGEKILMDQVLISDSGGGGFDPNVFVPIGQEERIWRNHAYFDKAVVKQNYRKFYRDTVIGRLMVLREDRPRLFHLPTPTQEEALASMDGKLERIRTLMQWTMYITAVILLYLLFR